MLLSVEELEASAKIDPSIEEFIKANPIPPLDWSDANAMFQGMAMLTQMQLAQIGPANPEIVTEEYKEIAMRDGYQSKLKILKPVRKPSGGSPLVVFAFGGGFIGGDCDQGTAAGRMFVKAFGAVVVLISYRLAPQHKFPTSHNDAWDSVKWIADNATGELSADPSKGFIMSGISAGGNIASSVVTNAISEPLSHPFTGQWLGVPIVLDDKHTPEKYKKYHLSLKHNTDTPILATKDIDYINEHTDPDLDSPWRFPILSKSALSKQPKAYIQADGLDPLRDDALIWDEILKDNGVETKIDFYPGCPHAHWGFFAGVDVSNKAILDLIVGIAWLLGEELGHQDAAARAL